ncbi:hypothetical protein GH714_038573 [Hevea brasiliensis]|uniref:Retrotransposon gag domain-containing protein n=1 Tax=Hevea brasiliensis TaxID=3981 RepID=A0A6A6N575_HEVBR|nr:hypothetical protein GH714_038573 [Hevea brasiliensis]
MSDPSEVIPKTSVAPGGEEQGRGRRKGRGKSRDPGRAREELGDFEAHLAKVELHLIEGEEKFKQMDTHLEELDGKMEELCEELHGALDSAINKLASEGESFCLSHPNNYAVLRDENRSLREQVDRVVKENTHLRGELDKVLRKLKEYFRALGIADDARKIDHAPLYLVNTAMVWWRRRQADREKGLCTINTWEDFKKELKRQFYPENVAKECQARLRRLSQKGSIRDYVKEFSETLLEIPNYPDQEAFYA